MKIWRYLDFTKFASLLDRRALFFARADRLPDPFEGSYSKANIRLRPELYKDIPDFSKFHSQIETFSQNIRKFVIINSWCMNEYESAAMWKLYLKGEEGISIQSTFKRLAESFHTYEEKDVYIGKVKYIDYETEWLPEGNFFYPFLHKRKSFEHERELRAIIWELPLKEKMPGDDAAPIDWTMKIFDIGGAYIPVDLDMLIERIFISPTAKEWFNELVQSIMNKYNVEKEVIQSSLSDGPVY